MERLNFLFSLFSAFVLVARSSASVVLIGKNVSLSLDAVEATFASSIKDSGMCGVLHVAEPLDACSPLTEKAVEGEFLQFLLIIRGACTFESKVRNAQDAGFHVAIVYNNENSSNLVAMTGNSEGITTHAVFVSRAAGEVLLKYGDDEDIECWIIPSVQNAAWTVIVVSLVSLLGIAAVLAACFCLRRRRLRRRGRRHSIHSMSARQVKALPCLIFGSAAEDNCTSETCAICLEDYTAGVKLRVLPCNHKFHMRCIDSWLTMWRTFCPVCKRDARNSIGDHPASEDTPLLSSPPVVPSRISSSVVGSMHSSPLESPAMNMPSTSGTSRVESSSRNASPYLSASIGSPISSRNSIPIGNACRHLSLQSLFSHSNSMEIPESFFLRHGSPFMPGSRNAATQSPGSFSPLLSTPSYRNSFTGAFPATSSRGM